MAFYAYFIRRIAKLTHQGQHQTGSTCYIFEVWDLCKKVRNSWRLSWSLNNVVIRRAMYDFVGAY